MPPFKRPARERATGADHMIFDRLRGPSLAAIAVGGVFAAGGVLWVNARKRRFGA